MGGIPEAEACWEDGEAHQALPLLCTQQLQQPGRKLLQQLLRQLLGKWRGHQETCRACTEDHQGWVSVTTQKSTSLGTGLQCATTL